MIQQIKKIKLVNGGLNGANITYITPKVVRNRTKWAEYTAKEKHPIHLGLEKLFKSLNPHLMEICGFAEEDKDAVSVSGIVSDYEKIGIIGQKDLSFTTGAKFTITGWKIDPDDGYVGYDDLNEIIKNILKETEMYMKGEVVVSEEELVERWINEGKAEVTAAQFEALGMEERFKIRQGIIEQAYGKLDEEEVGEDEVEETADFGEEHIPVVGDVTIIPMKPAKGRKKAAKTGTDESQF